MNRIKTNEYDAEQKELLIKDLCARLIYGVKGVNKAGIVTDPSDWYCGFNRLSKELENRICFSEWKPYLFPLSSMNERLREEHKDLLDNNGYRLDANDNVFTLQDFYCKYHIDYRGLIPMGLAIDCTNLNIY